MQRVIVFVEGNDALILPQSAATHCNQQIYGCSTFNVDSTDLTFGSTAAMNRWARKYRLARHRNGYEKSTFEVNIDTTRLKLHIKVVFKTSPTRRSSLCFALFCSFLETYSNSNCNESVLVESNPLDKNASSNTTTAKPLLKIRVLGEALHY